MSIVEVVRKTTTVVEVAHPGVQGPPGPTGPTGPYGTLTDGTILRTSEAFAAHLVNECNAADYVAKTEKTPEEKPVRKGK